MLPISSANNSSSAPRSMNRVSSLTAGSARPSCSIVPGKSADNPGYALFMDQKFHNIGVGAYGSRMRDAGRYLVTGDRHDFGVFKTPDLRNVSLTSPYMHDGSAATLEDVLDHYSAGGRTIATGPFAGRGHDNPNRDARMTGFKMTPQNRQDLLAFLRSLTDIELVRDPRFSNPW